MELIKDINNMTSSTKGLQIPDIVGGDPASDESTSYASASLSLEPPTLIRSRPLDPVSYTLVPTL